MRFALLASIAVFAALPAADSSAAPLPANSVKSKQIKDGQVKQNDLADLAVTLPKLAANAVDSSKVVDDSIGGDDIDELQLNFAVLQARITGTCTEAETLNGVNQDGTVSCGTDDVGALTDGSVTTAKLADDAVTSAKVAPETLQDVDVGPDSVGASELKVNSVGNPVAESGNDDEILDGSVDTEDVANGSLTASDIDAATVQRRVIGACPAGQYMRAIDASGGSPTCAVDVDTNSGGDITSVTAGTGLSGGGTAGAVTLGADTSVLQARVATNCAAGSSIRTVNADGTVVCETDDGSSSASDLTSGTLADARLSANVALLNSAQTFTGAKSFQAGLNVNATSALTDGIGVSGTSAITDGLDVSDADIVNALNIGANNISTSGTTISSAELDRLDGKDEALLDTNDALNFARYLPAATAAGAGASACSAGTRGTVYYDTNFDMTPTPDEGLVSCNGTAYVSIADGTSAAD